MNDLDKTHEDAAALLPHSQQSPPSPPSPERPEPTTEPEPEVRSIRATTETSTQMMPSLPPPSISSNTVLVDAMRDEMRKLVEAGDFETNLTFIEQLAVRTRELLRVLRATHTTRDVPPSQRTLPSASYPPVGPSPVGPASFEAIESPTSSDLAGTQQMHAASEIHESDQQPLVHLKHGASPPGPQSATSIINIAHLREGRERREGSPPDSPGTAILDAFTRDPDSETVPAVLSASLKQPVLATRGNTLTTGLPMLPPATPASQPASAPASPRAPSSQRATPPPPPPK